MKKMKWISLACIAMSLVTLVGCGIPKDKYEAVLNEKILLEERANVLARAKDALKNEYDSLLNEKMDLATKVQTLTDEKAALKSEYDKLLDEKISLKAAYDKLMAESKDLRDRMSR